VQIVSIAAFASFALFIFIKT